MIPDKNTANRILHKTIPESSISETWNPSTFSSATEAGMVVLLGPNGQKEGDSQGENDSRENWEMASILNPYW